MSTCNGRAEEYIVHHMKSVIINDIKKVAKKGNFVLTSGKISNLYIDIKSQLMLPLFLDVVGRLISIAIREQFCACSAVGGMEMGSIPLSTATIMTNTMLFGTVMKQFVVRKGNREHGTAQNIEGVDSIIDESIVLIDDVLTTGSSLVKAIRKLSNVNTDIRGAIVVVDRQDCNILELQARIIKQEKVHRSFRIVPLVTRKELDI